jgi:hypothetical protein
MFTAINFDDELLAQVQLMSHLTERTQLLREAPQTLVQRENARYLPRLGGTEPHLQSASLGPERMIAVDSSVWIDHFGRGGADLTVALKAHQAKSVFI